MPQPFYTLPEWLEYVENRHTRQIDLGLERVGRVLDALDAHSSAVVITVGGTNGKGSTCAMLEAILQAAGYRVGLYTSPHLLRYNERVRIDRLEVADAPLCEAFAAVELARGDTPLTYFEFGTLAAWWLFCRDKLDVIILEVGLGGRLDAVNAIESACSVVTGVALDHMDYLGPTRESIGFEKAGIFRPHKPAICGDSAPPQSLLEHAQAIEADLRVAGRDFEFSCDALQWHFRGRSLRRSSLAYPALRGANQVRNAATVLATLEALDERLPVPMQAVRQGLMNAELPGRFQVVPGRPTVVLDVAHNPQAGAVLAANLAGMGFHPVTWAVCGMLADKDIAGSVAPLVPRVDHWAVCDLPGPRAASAGQISQAILASGRPADISCWSDPASAFRAVKERAGENDRIVVFGSFLTVAGVIPVAVRNAQESPQENG